MTAKENPLFRLPDEAPTSTTAADRADWLALRDAGLTRTIATATAWRNGLAGFVTLLTSALVLKGGDLSGVVQPYRFLTTFGLLSGTILAIIGLWRALAAEAPVEGQASLTAVVKKHGSVAGYLQAVALASQKQLSFARRLLAAALVMLLVGLASWWVSPQVSSLSKVSITWVDNSVKRTDCGILVASLPSEIALVNDLSDVPLIFRPDSIVSIVLVQSC